MFSRFKELGSGEESDDQTRFLCGVRGTISCLVNVKLTAGRQLTSDWIGDVTQRLLRARRDKCR